MLLVGFTAYGWLSEPTKIAEISEEWMPAISIACFPASKAMVKLSSSGPGTVFSVMPRFLRMSLGSWFQWRAISSVLMR